MCQYTQARYSCGHFQHGSTLGPGALVLYKCTPLKVALEYWHRQLQYLPVESPTGSTLPCPQACRPVRPFPREMIGNRAVWERDDETLERNMLAHGVDEAEKSRVLALENTPGLDSMRILPRDMTPSQDYPEKWYNFVRDFAVYQSLADKAPNVYITNTTKGCGRPGGRPCLARWTGPEILMLRMREWNTPPWTRWLRIDYGAIEHIPPRDPTSEPVSSKITVPISEALHRVLMALPNRPPRSTIGGMPRVVLPSSSNVTRSPEAQATSGGSAAVMISEEPESSGQQEHRTRRRASSLPEGTASDIHEARTRSNSSSGPPESNQGMSAEEAAAAAGPWHVHSTAGTSQTAAAHQEQIRTGQPLREARPSASHPTTDESVEEVMSALHEFQVQEAELFGAPHQP